MNICRTTVVLVLLVLLAAIGAGCTGTSPSASPATPVRGASTTASPSATPVITSAPQTQTIAAAAPARNIPTVFTGSYHWAEYRNNMSTTMPPNPRFQWETQNRVERSLCTWQGNPAVCYKTTQTGDYSEWVGGKLVDTKNGESILAGETYGTDSDTLLAGTLTDTIKGVPQRPVDLTAEKPYRREDRPNGLMGISPFSEMNITLTFEGTEKISVPAGTFPEARTYSGTFLDGCGITFWVSDGVPVPVQYRIANKYIDGEDPVQQYELKGWG